MNGRVYDYNLGRFLSVDPFIQSPGNSQSMNPYSYIMNNPLAGTDPSGYISYRDAAGGDWVVIYNYVESDAGVAKKNGKVKSGTVQVDDKDLAGLLSGLKKMGYRTAIESNNNGTTRVGYSGVVTGSTNGISGAEGIVIPDGQTEDVTQSVLTPTQIVERTKYIKDNVTIKGYPDDTESVLASVVNFGLTDTGWKLFQRGIIITVQRYGRSGAGEDKSILINIRRVSYAKAGGDNNYVKLEGGFRTIVHELVHVLTIYNNNPRGAFYPKNELNLELAEGSTMALTNRIMKQHFLRRKLPLSKLGERTHYSTIYEKNLPAKANVLQ